MNNTDWLTRVPNKNAENMPNGTIQIPGDEEHSVRITPLLPPENLWWWNRKV